MITREVLSQKIRWNKIMFALGLLNPLAFVPQIYAIVTTHVVAGISIQMFSLFVVIQLSFFINGFFQRDKAVMISMGSSALLTSIAIMLTLYYR
jgi:uncharacterized protein with PQ loop repeat